MRQVDMTANGMSTGCCLGITPDLPGSNWGERSSKPIC
jgi:hypothetical protein